MRSQDNLQYPGSSIASYHQMRQHLEGRGCQPVSPPTTTIQGLDSGQTPLSTAHIGNHGSGCP